MVKVSKHVARKGIYTNGLRTEDKTLKKGFSLDRSKPANEKDAILIQKGETYYSWSLFGDKKARISKTYPKPQQLTNSGFKISLFDLKDRISALDAGQFSDNEEFKSEIEDIIQEIRNLSDEQDEKWNNMPEGLQSGSTGELLESRRDSLNEWADEIEGIDLDYDGDNEEIEDTDETALTEHLEEKIDEIQNCDYNGED